MIDPLVDTGSHCPLVNKIRIRGVGCDMCVVNMIQDSDMWSMRRKDQNDCDHLAEFQNVVPSKGCGYNKPRYFGSYNQGCIDKKYSCTSSADATTQLWFVHITV